MKIVLLVLGGIVAIVVVMAVVGALLPRTHVASRSVTLRQAREAVFIVVRNFASTASWRSGLQTVELLPPRDGRPCYRETSRHGAITYVVLEEKPAEKLVVKIADETLPFGGTWTFTFTPAGEGTTVRITEDGEVKNVVFRFLGGGVFGYTRTIETYLLDLGRKFGETVTPTA